LRALGYFLTMTVIALGLGLLAGNLIKPGGGFEGEVSASAKADAKESIGEAGGDQGIVSFITDDLLPTSFVSPFVENEILRVLVLALLVAAAVSGLPKVQREKVVAVFEAASQIIFRVIRLIMWAAPIGAFGGMAFTVSKFGGTSLTSLGLLMVTFWGTCAVFVFGVLGLVSRLAGFSVIRLIRLIRDELLIILGTSSSETVLPRLLVKLETAGASRRATLSSYQRTSTAAGEGGVRAPVSAVSGLNWRTGCSYRAPGPLTADRARSGGSSPQLWGLSRPSALP
jgi:aerobic C4-dicarboxylate transport protein